MIAIITISLYRKFINKINTKMDAGRIIIIPTDSKIFRIGWNQDRIMLFKSKLNSLIHQDRLP